MNKQELIEYYKKILDYGFLSVAEEKFYRGFVEKLEQLDEPQRAVVPQFVADYIEFEKENNFHVYGAMRVIEDHYDKRVPDWFYEKNIETFVRAWLDGYTVEEEKRYLVKIKNVYNHSSMLKLDSITGRWFFGSEKYMCGSSEKHTRKELEQAGFEWVFDCPGIEIEEVKG